MYTPPFFGKEDTAALHAAMAGAGLAPLITTGLEASHVPMLLDADAGPNGTLYGHLARANRQWERASPSELALAVFLGPDSYVSPGWYPSKAQTGKVVPTWNYVAIHAHGPVRFFDGASALHGLVSKLTARHENGRDQPWNVDDAPADFTQAQLKAIVGFALSIERLEGKWKMSQNRSAADRAGVVSALTETGDSNDKVVADLIISEAEAKGWNPATR